MQVARDGELGSRLIDTNWLNFAPRIGIAYSPATNWVIRTGFGIFYSQESKNSIFDTNRTLSGRTTVGPNPQTAPTVNYQNFINTSQLPVQINPAGLTWGASPHLPTTYSMMYVFNVQRQFGSGTTIEAGYNGALHRDLVYLVNQNQPVPGVSTYYGRAPYAELSYIQYLNADANGNYNGASIKLTQRLQSGLTVLASYTYSKALDEASAIRGTNASNDDFALENALCRACDYGPSSFNLPHRMVASVLYALPLGRGKQFLNKGGAASEILGGWNVSGILTMQSGSAVDTGSWDSAGFGNGNASSNRLNCLGVSPYVSNPNPNNYLNVADFANTVAIPNSYASLGNCGRNDLMGPRTTNLDFSALKDFRITESQKLQFRAELFNAPNHPEFAPPNAHWGIQSATPSASFGLIRSTTTIMRQIQFALKYVF